MNYRIVLSTLCVCATSIAHAQQPIAPAYVPTQQYSGTIHSWGHGFLKLSMKNWEAGFQKFQPNVKFDDTLVSSAAAIAGLYTGRADIGVLAREITPPEIAAYEKMTQQKLFPIDVLTGSAGNPDKIMALGIFVNKSNPIAHLTYDQLDAIFSAERRRGEKELIRTWGQLGLTGAWANKPIQPYSGPAFEAPGYFFSQTVLNGSVLLELRPQAARRPPRLRRQRPRRLPAHRRRRRRRPQRHRHHRRRLQKSQRKTHRARPNGRRPFRRSHAGNHRQPHVSTQPPCPLLHQQRSQSSTQPHRHGILPLHPQPRRPAGRRTRRRILPPAHRNHPARASPPRSRACSDKTCPLALPKPTMNRFLFAVRSSFIARDIND